MFIEEYISSNFEPISINENIGIVEELTNKYNHDFLPVVDNGKFVGCILSDFSYEEELDEKVLHFKDSFESFSINYNSNFIDVINTFAKNNTNIIPVIDDENIYLGFIVESDIISFLSNSPFISEIGSVLIISRSIREYSFSEISKIVEAENIKLTGAFISKFIDDKVIITLKLNQVNLDSVISSLKRFGYIIEESFYENNNSEDYNDRYNSLMKYLNI